jgi:hypothetical protein
VDIKPHSDKVNTKLVTPRTDDGLSLEVDGKNVFFSKEEWDALDDFEKGRMIMESSYLSETRTINSLKQKNKC